jgi:hypothetical protein
MQFERIHQLVAWAQRGMLDAGQQAELAKLYLECDKKKEDFERWYRAEEKRSGENYDMWHKAESRVRSLRGVITKLKKKAVVKPTP